MTLAALTLASLLEAAYPFLGLALGLIGLWLLFVAVMVRIGRAAPRTYTKH